MKLTLLFVLLIEVVTVFCSGENVPPQPIPSTDVPTTQDTTSASPITTPVTTTTQSTTNSSTTPSTTTPQTTPSPKPTTLPPTSTPQTTTPQNTTSVSPITTPLTTPAPNTTTTTTTDTPPTTPTPQPKTDKWIVKDKNVTCIVANMTLQLNITFEMKENKSVVFEVPYTANATGSCDNVTQVLVLQWEKSNVTASITISFEKNETAKLFSMSQVNVSLPFGFVPDVNASLDFFENKDDFSTPLSRSYKCAKVQQLQLTHSDNSTSAVLKISHAQFEAFREKQDENFGSAEDCESSNSSTDVVPIAVGCVLVGLVVIVLVAYLVGRRRSQSRGYLSM